MTLAVDWVAVSSIVTAAATLVLALNPRDDGRWIAFVSRHWNVDRPDVR